MEPEAKGQVPVSMDQYEAMAEAYAAAVDTKPHNAYYERPAMLSLMPPLAGLSVLDAGCGSGWYAETMTEQGATVTAIDASPKLVAMTRARLGDRAKVFQADLGQPLDFLDDNAFELVISPLVLHYLETWEPTLSEFYRLLRPGGRLLFSTHHPFMDFQLFGLPDYFRIELLEDEWSTGKVTFYRRPLTAIAQALSSTGFLIECLLEPRPTPEFERADPTSYAKLMVNPWFLLVRALRPK